MLRGRPLKDSPKQLRSLSAKSCRVTSSGTNFPSVAGLAGALRANFLQDPSSIKARELIQELGGEKDIKAKCSCPSVMKLNSLMHLCLLVCSLPGGGSVHAQERRNVFDNPFVQVAARKRPPYTEQEVREVARVQAQHGVGC